MEMGRAEPQGGLGLGVGVRPHHKPDPVCTTNQNQDNQACCLNYSIRSELGAGFCCFLVIELLASA